MILYLVRHGESLFNAQRRIQGQSDVELSPLGHRQASAVADALGSLSIEAIYSSPLRRAMQTAQTIAERLKLEIHCDDRLKEINAGMFQGLRWDEIEQLHPAEAERWKAHEADYVIPGGESERELMVRGRACFEMIRATDRQHVVIVSHGGLMGAALKSLLQISAELNPFSFDNGSISRLSWEKQVEVLSMNQLEHLQAVELIAEDCSGDL